MFPLFFDLTNKRCLVVGGGKVAARKVRTLLEHCPHVCVIAESCSEDIRCSKAVCEERAFSPADLQDVFFVVAATDSPALNREIADLCGVHHILVNVATPYEGESVAFPSLITRGETVIGVNSGGNPALSKALRLKLERALPPSLSDISREGLAFREKQKESLTGEPLKNVMETFYQNKLE